MHRNTIKKLGTIATVMSGHPFRGKVEHDPNGEYGLVQLKNVDPALGINTEKLTRTTPTGYKNPEVLQVGDILFVNRGMRLFGVLVDKTIENAIAAPHFFIIRPDRAVVQPEFLAWFLNHTRAQRFFMQNAAGTSLPHVTRKNLIELTVALPPLEVQSQMARTYKCWLKEKQLTEQLLQQKEKLISGALDLMLTQKIIGTPND